MLLSYGWPNSLRRRTSLCSNPYYYLRQDSPDVCLNPRFVFIMTLSFSTISLLVAVSKIGKCLTCAILYN